jgi:hypothetical protein
MRILIAGDYYNPNGRPFLAPELRERFAAHDLLVCNLEAPVPPAGATPEPKAGPTMSQGAPAIAELATAGFRLCTLANNHMLDFGGGGLHHTMTLLGQSGIKSLGAENTPERACQPFILSSGGRTIALFNAAERQFGAFSYETPRGPGHAWLGHRCLQEAISGARGQYDLVLLIAHAGLEDSPLPLSYWRECFRGFCDSGVDLVVAHHPHVPQGLECWGGGIIVYSLGNLFFDGGGYDQRAVYGYAISMDWEPGPPPVLERVPHKQHEGLCLPADETHYRDYLAELDALLGDPQFDVLSAIQCIDHMERYVHPWYAQALLGSAPGLTLTRRLYHGLATVLAPSIRSRKRRRLLFHLLNNETLRELSRLALATMDQPPDPQARDRYLQLCRRGRRYAPL